MSSRRRGFFRGGKYDVAITPAAAWLAFVATLVLLAGIWAWLIVAAKLAVTWRVVGDGIADRITAGLQSLGVSPRLPLVSWTPRQAVPWTAIDLLVVIGLYVAGSGIAAVLSQELPETGIAAGRILIRLTPEEALIVSSTAASLVILAIGLSLISFRTGAAPRDFGWSHRDAGIDLKMGLIAFVMLAPPVYALQGLLVSFWQESKHPLVEMFKEEPSAGFFAILFVSAAIVAPLFEEIVFRVLLQGLLEKVFSPARAANQPTAELQSGVSTPPNNFDGDIVPLQRLDDNPYASPQAGGHELAAAKSLEAVEQDRGVSWLPVIITSAIFAALHYSHGPDWIPLFFLAMGLGYLYQRTHRLLPSLVVHALLNAISMWGLWVTVKQGVSS
jgi:membrane protease YdiL (CAAX protease family)